MNVVQVGIKSLKIVLMTYTCGFRDGIRDFDGSAASGLTVVLILLSLRL